MTEYLNDHPPTKAECDPLVVLGEFDLEPRLVEMVTHFGGENPETALLSRMFWFDGDFDLVWETQFEEEVRTPRDVAAQSALKWGLLVLFAPSPDRCEDEDFQIPECSFARWQEVTRTLLKFQDLVQPDHPWLFGWARFGVYLCGQVRAPRLVFWDNRVAKAASPCAIDASVGKVYADELPWSIDKFRALRGIGDATIMRVEQQLVEMLFHPEVCAPTLEEMGWAPLEIDSRAYVAKPEPGRNEPCWCGSGIKYKKCCLHKEPIPA